MRDSRIAAIFDVDGTLLTGRSMERTFYGFLYRTGQLRSRDLVSCLKEAVAGTPILANRCHLRGQSERQMQLLARECFEGEIKPRLLPAIIERLGLHRVSGHEPVLVSGTLDLLLAPLAEYLGVLLTHGTRLEVSQGALTGRITGVHPYGEGKVICLHQLESRHGIDLGRSFAYANHRSDRHLLRAVGHPVATNPDWQLRRLARKSGWMIEDFTREHSFASTAWRREAA